MKYLEEYIFLQRDLYIYFYIFIIGVLLIIMSVAILSIEERFNRLTVELCVKLHVFTISVLVSLWIFNLFYLHIAILIWIVGYLVLTFLMKRYYIVLWWIKIAKKNRLTLSRHELELFQTICRSVHFSSKNLFKGINEIRHKTIYIAESVADVIEKKSLKHPLFPISTYVIGIVVPAINAFVFERQYSHTNCELLVLIENYIPLVAVLFVIYPIAYYLTVNNEVHSLYGCKTIFKVIYISFAIVLLAILTGISIG